MLEKIALQKGLISKEDFNKAIAACKDAENYEAALKEYFISKNIISPPKVNQLLQSLSILRIMKKNMRFGQAAIKLGFLDKNVLQTAITQQKKAIAQKRPFHSIGQILFEAGKLSKEQLEQILKQIKLGTKKLSSAPLSKPESPEAPGIEKNNDQADPDTEKPKTSEDEKLEADASIEVEGGMILEIEANGLAAYLKKTDQFDDTITVEDIYAILAGHRIQFGLANEKMIEGFINSSGFKSNTFKIASGIDRVVGMDARIEYYFDTDYLKAGGMDEEGNIDFKDRGAIPKIEEGTLLARKFPLTPPKNGRNIYGEELETLPVNDIELRTQSGAILFNENTELYAEISGYPKLTWTGHINVIEDFIVKGDVNYETGHVIYDGNIEVKGCLKSGFNITGRNIKIQEVDGGIIIAHGDLTIVNGVNNATIYSRGHVNAKFIHNATIFCLGNLNIDKEIVDSKIKTSGTCNIKRGEIINSKVSSNSGVEAKNLGTSKTAPNTIEVGVDTYLETELQKIDQAVAEIDQTTKNLKKKADRLKIEKERYQEISSRIVNEIEKCRHDGREIKKAISQIENPSEKSREIKNFNRQLKQNESLFKRLDRELNECFDIIENNEVLLKEIEARFKEFEETLEDLAYEKENFIEWGKANTGRPLVVVSGMAFSDTAIKGVHSTLELKENITRTKIREVLLQNTGGSHPIYEMQIHENIKA